MASPSTKRDLNALRRLIDQADLVLATIHDPHPSVASARESLSAALVLTTDLIKRKTEDVLNLKPAAALGAKGGNATAKRGPEYFARIASMRKTRAGGRPPKTN